MAEVHSFCTRALTASGLYPESVAAVARTITAAERDGCQSHGLFRLPGYCNTLRAGKADREARPQVMDSAPGVVRVDAQGGLAPYALETGLPELVAKVRRPELTLQNIAHCSRENRLSRAPARGRRGSVAWARWP
jgi:delta1-piperideine-2-carboxylate reductase